MNMLWMIVEYRPLLLNTQNNYYIKPIVTEGKFESEKAALEWLDENGDHEKKYGIWPYFAKH